MTANTTIIILTVLLAQMSDAEALGARVRELGARLRIERKEDVPVYERAMAEGGSETLLRLLREFTLAVLRADPDAPADALEARLRSAYDPWSKWSSEYTARAPEIFRASLADRPVIAVSWLTYLGGAGSPRGRARILFYVKSGREWVLAAETGELLNDHGLFVVPVASSRDGELWYLLHGVRFGSSRVDINLALVAFDGQQVRTRWSRQNLASGHVSVSATGVTLEYREYMASGHINLIAEEWAFTRDGVERQSRRQK
jgi:hypothetical protein